MSIEIIECPSGCPVNWDYVDEKWNVLAIDQNGDVYFYEKAPIWDKAEEVWSNRIDDDIPRYKRRLRHFQCSRAYLDSPWMGSRKDCWRFC